MHFYILNDLNFGFFWAFAPIKASQNQTLEQINNSQNHSYSFAPVIHSSSARILQYDLFPLELEKRELAATEFWKKLKAEKEDSFDHQDVIELYRLAGNGFLVQGLVENVISQTDSLKIGKIRKQLHLEVIKKLIQEKSFGERIGVNDFSPIQDLETNFDPLNAIEFSLYCDNQRIQGEDLVKKYNQFFSKMHQIEAKTLNIFATNFEDILPDWQKCTGVAMHRLSLSELPPQVEEQKVFFQNIPESPITDQRTHPGIAAFQWYSFDENDKLISFLKNPALEKAFYYQPDVSSLYAWGASISLWHYYNAYSSSLMEKANILLRSIDEGVGLLLGAQKTGQFIDLPLDQRNDLIQNIYESRFSEDEIERIQAALNTSVKIVQDKSYHDFSTLTNFLNLFRPFLDFEKKLSVIDIEDKELMGIILKRYDKTCQRILIENNLLTSSHKYKNWLNPSILENQNLTLVSPDGSTNKVAITNSMLDSTRLSTLIEIKNALTVMNYSMYQQFLEQNPASESEIELLWNLIEKHKQMISAPDRVPNRVAALYRKNRANEVLADYRKLKQTFKSHSYASSNWQLNLNPSIDEDQFNAWVSNSIEDGFSSMTGGSKYVPIFQKLETDLVGNPQLLLSSSWLIKLNRLDDLIEILKIYAREGAITQNVLKNALFENLSYVPGISTLYTLTGNLLEDSTFQLTRAMPGYKEISFSCRLNHHRIEIVRFTKLEPIKNDQVKSAFQDNTHQIMPITYPVNPKGELSVTEAREKLAHYFHRYILLNIQRDDVVWFTEEEKPREWQQKELDYLKAAIEVYVTDWIEGKGLFESEESSQIDFKKEIQQELSKQLIQDYLTVKAISIELSIEEKEKEKADLIESFREIAQIDLAIQQESLAQQSNMLAAGTLFLSFVLDQMPIEETELELISLPFLNPQENPHGSQPISDSTTLIATIKGSLKENFGPWNLSWDFSQVPLKNPTTFFLIKAAANLFDSNNQKIGQKAVILEIDQLFDKGLLSSLRSASELQIYLNNILLKVETIAKDSSQISADLKKECADGKNSISQAIAILDENKVTIKNIKNKFKNIDSSYKAIEEKILPLEDSLKMIEDFEEKLSAASHNADEWALVACQNVSSIINSDSSKERTSLLSKIQKAKEEVVKIHKFASKIVAQSIEASQKIQQLKGDAKNLIHEIDSIGNELSAWDSNIRVAKRKASEATEILELTTKAINMLSHNMSLSQSIYNEAKTQIKNSQIISESIDILDRKINAITVNNEVYEENLQNCSNDLKQLLRHYNEQLNELEKQQENYFDKVNQLRHNLLKNQFTHKIDLITETAKSLMFRTDLFWEAITNRLVDAQKCEKLGKEAVKSLKKHSMPNVRGLSVIEATNKLTELKLKVSLIGGNPAPNDELSFRVEAQSPEPGTEMTQGDIVTITIYSQHRQILPNLRGLTWKEANSKLSGMQLKVSKVGGDPAPEEQLAYKIQSQYPMPGSQVSSGEAVQLIIYGPYSPIATMPNLLGLKKEDATEKLRSIGLIPVITVDNSAETQNSSIVHAQTPEAGQQLPVGSKVTITINDSEISMSYKNSEVD